ncbi:MAG: four helix bundle protein [Bacteroidales bacterium]|nr:four helix bundle protein [Bacteroidales bacterium]
MASVNSFKDLIVYKKAFKLAMEIFETSKTYPKGELYALTDQIRRSSRGITSNLAEAWAKKIYIKAFINKISDALGEEYETEVWLDYALHCNYIKEKDHHKIMAGYEEVRKILISMINPPEKFCIKP